jgi:nucleotide-binding universal stress UspA family protein
MAGPARAEELMASTILVPIDFQDASFEALKVALSLGERLGLEPVLLHVFNQGRGAYAALDPSMFPGLPADFVAAAKAGLDNIAAASGKLRTVFRDGEPASEILGVVRELMPDFVVMGTHGRKGMSHLLLGSVAENVIRESPVPVVTVRIPPK